MSLSKPKFESCSLLDTLVYLTTLGRVFSINNFYNVSIVAISGDNKTPECYTFGPLHINDAMNLKGSFSVNGLIIRVTEEDFKKVLFSEDPPVLTSNNETVAIYHEFPLLVKNIENTNSMVNYSITEISMNLVFTLVDESTIEEEYKKNVLFKNRNNIEYKKDTAIYDIRLHFKR